MGKKALHVPSPTRGKKIKKEPVISKKQATAKIIAINRSISDKKISLTQKRAGEKHIRALKRVIGKKTNEFFPSELERLKSERKSLSARKSYLNQQLKNGKAKTKKAIKSTELEILRIASRQMQVAKWINPEKFDRRRKENKAKPPKRDYIKWILEDSGIPIYQVKAEILDPISTNKKVKKFDLNDKTILTKNWDEVYLEWQAMYKEILNNSIDLRSGKMKASNHFFSLYRNKSYSRVKLEYQTF